MIKLEIEINGFAGQVVIYTNTVVFSFPEFSTSNRANAKKWNVSSITFSSDPKQNYTNVWLVGDVCQNADYKTLQALEEILKPYADKYLNDAELTAKNLESDRITKRNALSKQRKELLEELAKIDAELEKL